MSRDEGVRDVESSGVVFGVHDLALIDHQVALSHQLRAAKRATTWTWAGFDATTPSSGDLKRLAKIGPQEEFLWDGEGRLGQRFAAIFVQTPYEEQRHGDWRRLSADDGLAYSGYGVTISSWREGHYYAPLYLRCRYILLSTPSDFAPFRAAGIEDRRLLHTGSPILFDLVSRRRTVAVPTDPVLLWMPHWTEDWFGSPGYSTWTETVFDVLHSAENEPTTTFIVRPHPLLRRQLEAPGRAESPPQLAYRNLLTLPNVELSTNDLIGDLLAASAVLTDGVSPIAYAAAVGMPLAVCRRFDSPPFSPNGERIAAAAETVVTSGQRRNWIKRQANSPARARNEHLQQVVLSCFPLHDRSPGEVFAERLDEVS